MGDRAEVERVVRQAYTARERNDLEGFMEVFAERPFFRIAGTRLTSPVTMASSGRDELRRVLEELIAAFCWIDHTIVTMLIEGPKAAVFGRIRFRAASTGDLFETEVADFIEVKDGRIVSLTKFCDTALAAYLMEPAEQ